MITIRKKRLNLIKTKIVPNGSKIRVEKIRNECVATINIELSWFEIKLKIVGINGNEENLLPNNIYVRLV